MTSNRREYYSISPTCNDRIKRFISDWFSSVDKEMPMTFTHITDEVAYKQILTELSTMEDRFYEDFDERKLRRSPTGKDWKDFAIPEISKMLDVIYEIRNYSNAYNDELTNNDNSESNEKPSKNELCTPMIARIRILYANMIWSEWSNERLWGPRVGVILISTMESGAEKVLLISYLKNNVFSYGYPKGKPNDRETIRAGGIREFKEEIGVDDLISNLQLDENDGVVIKKYPHIGSRGRCRTHYYVITTTSSQFTSFRPKKNEILDVEWHSIYTLPCCDHCQIKRKYRLTSESDIPINYHMVTLRDTNNENSTILDILAYVDEKNNNRDAYNKYCLVSFFYYVISYSMSEY